MSKKKVLSIAWITILTLYIISAFFVFDLSKSSLIIGYKLRINIEQIEKSEYLNPFNNNIIDDTPENFAYAVMQSIENVENYPFMVSIIDSHGRIVAQVQYHNGEQYNEIYNYLKEDAQTYASNLDITQSGGASYSDSNEFNYHRTVEFKEFSACSVYLNSKINLRQMTLQRDSFQSQIRSLTTIFLFVGYTVIFSLSYVISKNEKMQKAKYAFTNAAAHELKTPLAVIENQCECVLENINREKNLDYVKSIYEESIRMTQLVKSLLQYNKLSFTDKIKKEKVSLDDIISEQAEKYSSFAASKGMSINVDIDTKAIIKCNRELISLALDNYISNALKYSENSNEILISLRKYHFFATKLSVFNKCNPINSDSVWDVLYKIDTSRNNKSTGMGLAINKMIFELHNFKYGYKNKNGGVEFYFIGK